MKKLDFLSSIEYDETLFFWISEAPELGASIPNDFMDDNGKHICFAGTAIVVCVEYTQTPIAGTTVYVKIFPEIPFLKDHLHSVNGER